MDAAVLAGDPCYDRMLAARTHRQRFRRALGVRRGQRLLVLNSTWNTEGFFGNGGSEDLLPSVLPRLGAELPADEYRIAAVLHPNIWHGHGPGQIRAWLDRARRNGLVLIDPLLGWRQALLAADIVLGDFGAVSYYAAALGIPVLLAAADLERLDPETPLAEFVRGAPRLDAHAPLRDQLDRTFAEHRALPDPARFVSSAPGESAALLRRNFYALLGIPEPPTPALLEPLPLPPYEPPRRTTPMRVRTSVRGQRVHVERSTVHPYTANGEAHLAVHEDTRDPSELIVADVIVREGPPDDPRLGSPATWTTEVLDQYPYCALAAYVTGPDTCTVQVRQHGLLQLTASPEADLDPAAYASALHAWLRQGRLLPPEGLTLRVCAAGGTHPVSVQFATQVARSGGVDR
ncbi:hypothetical protein [Streptomyces sp. NPDC003435]